MEKLRPRKVKGLLKVEPSSHCHRASCLVWWVCACLFLTWNNPEASKYVIGHVVTLNRNWSLYPPLLLFLKCHLFFSLSYFPFHLLSLYAIALNCDGDKALFFKAI